MLKIYEGRKKKRHWTIFYLHDEVAKLGGPLPDSCLVENRRMGLVDDKANEIIAANGVKTVNSLQYLISI